MQENLDAGMHKLDNLTRGGCYQCKNKAFTYYSSLALVASAILNKIHMVAICHHQRVILTAVALNMHGYTHLLTGR